MPSPVLAGFLYDSVGVAVSGAEVRTFKRNDTATALSSTTTNASGYWTITESTADGMWPDIQITNGTEITRYKYDDQIAVTKVDAQSYVARNDSATSSFGITITPTTLTKDQTFNYPILSSASTVGEIAVLGGEQLVTASNAPKSMFPVTLFKTATTSIADNDSTTVTTDPHLSFPGLDSATTYRVEAAFRATHDASGQPVYSFVTPTGALADIVVFGGGQGDTTKVQSVGAASSFSATFGAGNPTTTLVSLVGTLITTTDTGTFGFGYHKLQPGTTNTQITMGYATVQKVSS